MRSRTFTFLMLALVVCYPIAALSNWADDKRMADEALAPFVDLKLDASERRIQIEAYHTKVADKAQSDPTLLTSATIIFDSGRRAQNLERIIQKHRLRVMAVDVKAPINDLGVVQSIHIGAEDLLKWRGSDTARIRKAIGSFRVKFLERAEKIERVTGSVTESTREYREVAKADLLIYRVDVFGDALSIHNVISENGSALVVLHKPSYSEGMVASYQLMKEKADEHWKVKDTVE